MIWEFLLIVVVGVFVIWMGLMAWYMYNPPVRGRHRFPDDPDRFNYKRHYQYWCPDEEEKS